MFIIKSNYIHYKINSKKFIERQESKGKKVAYISLNGLSKTSDIDDEIFRCIHPKLASKGAKILGKVAKGALKVAFRFDWDGDSKHDGQISTSIPNIVLPDYLKITAKFILVFDDLERCELKKEEILGYINYFVEQEGIKTLIVSNEEEIKDNEEYARKKEKLIGATFSYTEDQDLAIQSILNEVNFEELKRLLNTHLGLIKQTFNQVGYKNLRSFKQAIFDFERFYKKEYFVTKENFDSDIFEKILKAFLILSLENKKGYFEKAILEFKKDKIINDEEKTDTKPDILKSFRGITSIDSENFMNKYQSSMSDFIFSPSLWNEILNLNIIEISKIKKELHEKHFRLQEEKPIWWKLWHYLDLTDTKFSDLVKKAKESIEKAELNNVTDILHTVSMLVYFKEKSLIYFSIDNLLLLAISQYKKIVNLQENIKKLGYFDISEESGGYGLYARELPIFQKFIQDIAQAYEDKYIEKNEERGKVLLTLMENDSYEFHQQITNKFYDYPILNSLEPIDFLNQLLKIDYRSAMYALDGLNSRYTVHSQSKIYLQEEKWFEKLIDFSNENITQSTRLLEKHKIKDKFLPKLIEINKEAYKG